MPRGITPAVFATSLELMADATANDSDKTFTVDANERWHVFSIYVSLTTTATVGNRQLQVNFRDASPIHAQTEADYDNSPTTEGTFSGGTGHAASDVITLEDGTTITVDNVTGGVVDQFTVDSTGAGRRVAAGATLTQSSTDGSGTGFTLTPDADNIGNVFCSLLAGATQAASLTYLYSIAPGLARETAVVSTSLQVPMPSTMFLLPGYSIRVYDSAAIAAGADDMTVRVYVDRGKAVDSGRF